MGGGKVLLGGEHLRGEASWVHAGPPGSGNSGALMTTDTAQDGEIGEPHRRGLGGAERRSRGRCELCRGRGRSRGRGGGEVSGSEGGGGRLVTVQKGADLIVNIELITRLGAELGADRSGGVGGGRSRGR